MQIRSGVSENLLLSKMKKKITKFKVIAMFSETSLDQQRKLSDRNRYFKVIKKV